MLTKKAMNMFRNAAVVTLGLLATFAVHSGGEAAAGESASVAANQTLGAEAESVTELRTIEGEGYRVKVTQLATSVGSPGHFMVVIEAKGGYKVNTKFPHKLKLAKAPSGLKLPKMVLKKKDGTFTGTKNFTFKVPVEASKAGDYRVKGKLKLSVCNAETCLIKKENLKAVVTAK
jgi:hypothetical protein